MRFGQLEWYKSPYHTLLHLSHLSIVRYTLLYHSSCPNRTCAECDKFEENNLSHCKNISWFSMFLFHEFFMVLCSYWVKLLQITDKLDSYCGIKSISHVDSCDKWRNVWYGLLSHSADASCDKSPYHTLLHLSHSSIVRYTLLLTGPRRSSDAIKQLIFIHDKCYKVT